MRKILVILILAVCILQARIVVDDGEKEVQIPDNVERVTPMIGAFTQMSAMLTGEDKIISGAARLPKMMSKIFPKIKTMNNVSGSLKRSAESIITSNTQVVFGPVGMMFDENQRAQLEAAGIAVVNINKFSNASEIKGAVSKIAEILGGDAVKKAEEFNEYFDENIKYVSEKVQNIKDKKRVLALNFNSGNFSTISSKDIGTEYIKIAGGINLSSQDNEADFKISKTINEEQVIIFNPDIIITNSREGKEKILNNPAFAKLKAVKDGAIFVVPSGVYLWSVRSAEGALQPLWLAKIFYPEIFTELNLEDEVKKFYLKFYRYELSDEELKEILNPK